MKPPGGYGSGILTAAREILTALVVWMEMCHDHSGAFYTLWVQMWPGMGGKVDWYCL